MSGGTGSADYTSEQRLMLCELNYSSMNQGVLLSLGLTGLYVGCTVGAAAVAGVEAQFSFGPVLTGFLCAEALYRLGQINKNAANSIRARRANPLVEKVQSSS